MDSTAGLPSGFPHFTSPARNKVGLSFMEMSVKLDITKEWFEKRAALEDGHEIRACHCIGPQNGAPVCPCRMEGVTIENGRYVEVRDLGPAKSDARR